MRTVVFTDLDDTLFQTEGKCPEGVPRQPMAVDSHGMAASFATPQQTHLLRHVLRDMEVIPVTGRTDDALSQVGIPFESFRITHHGAMSRRADGRPTDQWQTHFRPLLEAAGPVLQEAEKKLQETLANGGPLRARIHQAKDQGVLTYLSVKCERGAEENLYATLRQVATDFSSQLCWHHNGRNGALLVKGVGKAEAVRMLLQEMGEKEPILTLGVGDSLSDAPFMALCDFAIMPRRSQLQRQCLAWGG